MKKVILSYKFSVANKNLELAIQEPRKKKWMITFKNLKGQELYNDQKQKAAGPAYVVTSPPKSNSTR